MLFQPQAYAANVAKVLFSSSDKISNGKQITVGVYIDSNTDVNAAQLKIVYPESEFSFVSIDSTNSKFLIKAEESQEPGIITVTRGNIQALSGKQLFTNILLTVKSGANLNHLSYAKNDSLVMSKENVNILSGSEVLTVKPATPTPTPKKSFGGLFKKAVNAFFGSLFGWN